MKLSRRDALVALGAMGVGAGGVGVLRERAAESEEAMTDVLLAAAEVVYPSAVTPTREFVSAYAVGRRRFDADAERFERAVADLDRRARHDTGQSFASLSLARRRDVFRSLGADRAHANHGGTTAERVRYYVVDDLLYALFASPTGGELVGCENPPGHPGGTDAYQRGPEA
ncbi:gluconate 2-dehydrogenase subunit 3 family protein [Halomarina rubra]|uniref:Gluconate 2-dehydrogenase subunit 3 family protein n=1 Tax=Halomarina rubra TaxID=2071873 RepID=A0ABD6AZ29_9EURY|nr:gluconate 2-dehydrogenase subunit 3 family protein [Halomarina rubra]